ncbi:hypothetical protein PW5551_08810 [Petrotoga sp. 9PW.55.5.1]|uniref:hypothetical protein n=1 Tax=Petrotoga sp. 9PW.55.5.1 TaxID=1308979 RepID=UPI000DC59A7A|nr:hypothetical protein [Petrotoga sp. 9PW.55.5.1]RAO98574.1 hypothetical protein PW5551_08810 [Petrotoga sp. 9PW.55.5.1]
MIILKGNYGDYMKLRPISVKKIFLDEAMLRNNKNPDIYEKYIYEVEGRFGNYKWLNNEFNIGDEYKGKLSKLNVDIEYIPLVLTILRMNTFFKSKKKSMISILSSDHENRTHEIITEESFFYAINQENNLVFLFLKKMGKGLIEHHIIFTNSSYGDYFDIYIQTDRKSLQGFYNSLLKETNNFRVAVLPNIAQRITPFYDRIIEKISIVNYEDISEITDEYFSAYNLLPNDFIRENEAKKELERYTNFLYSNKFDEDDYIFDDDIDDVDLDFTIKNMEDIESELLDATTSSPKEESYKGDYYDDSYDLFIEMEEEFMDFMDHIIYDENIGKLDKEHYFFRIKNMINEVSSIFQDLKSKREFERELLLDLVNAYGIEQITNKKNLLAKIFEEIDMEKDLKEIYEISEDKILNDYKNWYKDIFSKNGKSMKEFIKN